MSPLTPWLNFYVILGSAAGGLTGLQFIAMALLADIAPKPGDSQSAEAFATPPIIHFVAVLLLAASGVMPWHGLTILAAIWTIAGLLGVAYTARVGWGVRHQSTYRAVLEDWLFRVILPGCGYLGIAICAALLFTHPTGPLFGIAASSLLLLVIAIHNAWDNATYLIFMKRQQTHRR